MTIEQATKELKKINKGLFVDVCRDKHRQGHYVIKYKDDRNGLVRDVRHILDEEGRATQLRIDEIKEFCRLIDWKNVQKYAEPADMATAFEKELKDAKLQQKLERQGFLLDMAKDRRKQWAAAFQEFKDSFTPKQIKLMKKAHEKEQWLKSLKA